LLKNFHLSDDLAFRFSNRDWPDYPLTAEKYANWIHKIAGSGEFVGLFMDYETFGEHQWKDTGIFEFLEEFPKAFLKKKDTSFVTPTEATKLFQPMAKIDVPQTISWADLERDTSAWMGNPLQDSALAEIYNLEKKVRKKGDPALTSIWRKLQTSDHFYYMCTKWSSDGEVHRYFNHFENPEASWVTFQNVVNDFRRRL
jgi:alpha-amylase